MASTKHSQVIRRRPAARRRPSVIEDVLFGCTLAEVPKLIPGLLLAAFIVVVSVTLADYVNSTLGFKSLISYIMTAIVIGLVVGNSVSMPAVFTPGISFCLKKLLRLGIIIMGIRLSIFDAARIGAWGIPIVLICVVTGLLLTAYFTRVFKLPQRLGTLLAVGTSICGASAIVATAPAIKAEDEEVAYAVANITVFGIIAMLVYPFLANAVFAGNVVMAGLFQGTAIHETAQVTGAALIYDQAFNVTSKPSAADVAIVTKLVRNVLMVAVIPVMAYLYQRNLASETGARAQKINIIKLFPMFILGFIAMAVIRSVGDAGIQGNSSALGILAKAEWSRAIAGLADTAGYALAMAMAGVGLGTNLKTLRGLGLKPFYLGLIAALAVGIASIVAVTIFGGQVAF